MHALAQSSRPAAGAIRWDAWHGDKSSVGQAVETSLGPEPWHYRLPFFADVLSDSSVRIDGASQEVMDREIAYASQAGLDYWAFVTYEPSSAMSLSLRYYLSSQHRHDIRFCLITAPGNWGSRGEYRPSLARFVELMHQDTYLKVQGNRPLIYVGFIEDSETEMRWGSRAAFRKVLDEFRKSVMESGAGNPYIAIMDFSPVRGRQLADDLGADAIACYAPHGDEKGAPYSRLAAFAERFWESSRGTGAQVIPTVMAGWDRRPRVEHPVPWEKSQKPGAGIEKYYQAPQPAELAAHLEHALDWTTSHAKSAGANAILIYAWNENDEGGWLVPTLSEGDARLRSIRKVLITSPPRFPSGPAEIPPRVLRR
jgi:hypothetical protein